MGDWQDNVSLTFPNKPQLRFRPARARNCAFPSSRINLGEGPQSREGGAPAEFPVRAPPTWVGGARIQAAWIWVELISD